MDKTDILSRLTFCEYCAFWHPLDIGIFKEKYKGYCGTCNKPFEGPSERYKDDFCSCGRPKSNAIKED